MNRGFGEKCSTFSINLMICEIIKQKGVKTPELCINFLTNDNRSCHRQEVLLLKSERGNNMYIV